jgi:uncharacterized protein YjiS (DUF1127 family)
MSESLSNLVRPVLAKRSGAYLRLFNTCCQAIARHFARRAAVKTLSELNDYALRDIGIERSQIEAAVHGFIDLSDQARM